MVKLEYILDNFNTLFDSFMKLFTFNNNIIQRTEGKFYQNNSKLFLEDIDEQLFLEDIDELFNNMCKYLITKYILTLLNYIEYNKIDNNYDLNNVNNYIEQEIQFGISYYDFVININSCMKYDSHRKEIIEKLQKIAAKGKKQKKQERKKRLNEVKKVQKIKEEIQNLIKQKIKDDYITCNIIGTTINIEFDLYEYAIGEYQYKDMVKLEYILNNFNNLFDLFIKSCTFNDNIIQHKEIIEKIEQDFPNDSKPFLKDINNLFNDIYKSFVTKMNNINT